MADGKSLAGGAITDEERDAYASDASLVERYFADAPTLDVVFPDVAVDGTLVLERGGRTIEIRHLGRGHTASDLVVWLPKDRVADRGRPRLVAGSAGRDDVAPGGLRGVRSTPCSRCSRPRSCPATARS